MESSLGPSVDEEERITSSEGSQMTSDNCVGGPVGWLGSSLNFRRRAAEKLVTLSVYETLLPAMADHSAMTIRREIAEPRREPAGRRLVVAAGRRL